MYSNTNAITEYPHIITIRRTTSETDNTTYPPTEVETTTEHSLKGFLDTPSTSEQLNYHNMQVGLTRVLYVPYGSDIKRTDIIECEGVAYKITGDLQDQGGQHEVLSAPVERV